jgi:hypothetical protein
MRSSFSARALESISRTYGFCEVCAGKRVHKISITGSSVESCDSGTMSAAIRRRILFRSSEMANLGNQKQTDLGARMGTISGDWSNDRNWWQENYTSRPYVSADRRFEDYEPAYRFGYESANRYPGRNFNDIQTDLRSDWNRFEGKTGSTWDSIKDAVHDAWDKVTGQK